MRTAFVVLIALAASIGWPAKGIAELIQWRLGGENGANFKSLTFLNVFMDFDAVEGAIQPFEFKPEQDVITQLEWTRYRSPIDLDYVVGKPRTWRAIGEVARPGNSTNPIEFVDGDIETHYSIKDWDGNGHIWSRFGEFYTLDFGTAIPVDRFVWLPADGVDPFTQEPYRPNYSLQRYELTGSNDVALVNQMEPRSPAELYYQPLDIALDKSEQSFEAITNMVFPLQVLQFLRIRPIPGNNGKWDRFSVADFELYGRGFVPRTRWVSTVIDLGQVVNIGAVRFDLSKWRKDDGEVILAPESAVEVSVELKTGLDDTPVAFLTYNDLQQQVEVSRADYERLKPRVFPWDPPSVGWRGPVVDDQTQWSFWSAPIVQSGDRPRIPQGRYLQLQIKLETADLWTYARLGSLVVEASPLLADVILGEAALASDLQPSSRLIEVKPGEQDEVLYDIKADFSAGQSGFDAVRFLTPSVGAFVELLMGDPLVAVQPDSIVEEAQGFVVYLPKIVGPGNDEKLRVHFNTTLFGVADKLEAEVFERDRVSLPQNVQAGDVSDEIGTDQLRIVAKNAASISVLGDLTLLPPVFTPQGDGVNDKLNIEFTLFRVLNNTVVEIDIYTLGGERVRQIGLEQLGTGDHRTGWDGLDATGQTVSPGLYLVQIKVETDKGISTRVQSVAVAY